MDASSISSETRGGFSSSDENGQYQAPLAPAPSARAMKIDTNCFISIYYTKKCAPHVQIGGQNTAQTSVAQSMPVTMPQMTSVRV